VGYFALNFILLINENIPISLWDLGVTALIIIRRADYWDSLRWWGWGWGIVVRPVICAVKYLSLQIWSLLIDLCLSDSTTQDFFYKFCRPLYNFLYQFSVTLELTFWHWNFTLNSNKSPTWSNNFSVYSSVVLCSWSGRPARPRTQHDCHHDTKVKPKAATAVIELLKMGGKTSETGWAVNKRQDNKLKNCWIRLVIYLICTMMHGLTNLKFYI
jgi:hypothetical protein